MHFRVCRAPSFPSSSQISHHRLYCQLPVHWELPVQWNFGPKKTGNCQCSQWCNLCTLSFDDIVWYTRWSGDSFKNRTTSITAPENDLVLARYQHEYQDESNCADGMPHLVCKPSQCCKVYSCSCLLPSTVKCQMHDAVSMILCSLSSQLWQSWLTSTLQRIQHCYFCSAFMPNDTLLLSTSPHHMNINRDSAI